MQATLKIKGVMPNRVQSIPSFTYDTAKITGSLTKGRDEVNNFL